MLMVLRKTKKDLIIYNCAAETRLNEYIIDNFPIKELGDVKVKISDITLRRFFFDNIDEKKPNNERGVDCNLKNDEYRYIGEAKSKIDFKPDSRFSRFHKAVENIITLGGNKKSSEVVYIAQAIMCQILPVYLHYNFTENGKNIRCYYGSAKESIKENGEIFVANRADNILIALQLLKKRNWISEYIGNGIVLENYNLIIFEIVFHPDFINRFKSSIDSVSKEFGIDF